ncbi:TonB-dependent receptor [Inhella gelatinilytica]|uniref:TonB-dependent receptor n=1 Tax=Inhella gelatinilytica TaxID=2795030 RepID=A0A931NCQ3_9BURK|nr:TonB-dependent receptor [Inhella gelatinilytica]MBH9551779.1 TonB-dependent receptor [Inhella gelatinilytica]
MKKLNGRREPFQVRAITLGCVAALMSMGAQAQEAQKQQEPAKLDTIVVTGIRKGIEDAISVKKNKDNIVEAISAEDIGKLPDSSIAESIARLPGLAAQRVAGRASNISIRGMSGDFATALLNGREQVSTGDNRGVEFDQYPSELLASVVVYKTPDGELVGQGLSGTIDLQTVRPLNFKKSVLAANARKEKSGVGTEFTGNGSRVNFSYIDQFADRTLGVAFGVAQLKSDVTTGRTETYNNNNTFKWTGSKVYPGWDGGAPGSVVQYTGGFKYFNDSTETTRTGAMGVVEYKPSKDFSSTLDLYYSKFDRETVKRGLEIQPEDSWKNASSPQYPGLLNPVITNGRLISGTWTNVNPLSRTIWEPRRDDLRSFGWNTKFGEKTGWNLETDLSYSNAKRDERIIEMEASIPTPGNVTVGNYNEVTALQYNYGDPTKVKLMDPESWGQNGYDKTIKTNDTIKAGRLTLGTPVGGGVFDYLSFGLNQANREKTKSADEYKLILKEGVGAFKDLPAGTGTVNVGGGNQFQAVAFDPAQVHPSYYNLVPNVHRDIALKSWEVREKVTTLFSKANLDTEFNGMPLRGNLGLQVVRTDQESSAAQVALNNNGDYAGVTPYTLGKTYNDVLPSLNLNLDLGDDQALRLGVAKVLARARMDQMSAARTVTVNQGKWSGGGGNPLLDPFRAKAFDLSFEKYWGTKAYFSAAAFYKDLESYIFDYTDTQYNFSGAVNSTTNPTPTNPLGNFTQPRNGKGGSIEGFELAASLPLDKLADALSGFGVVASFADTKSRVNPFGDSDTRSMPGLSRQVANLTFYYENAGFQARVSNRYRSNFLGEVQGFGANREYTYIKAESIIDAQIGYEFQSGPLKGLSALLQVNNLNNAKYQRYNGTLDKVDQIIDTIKYGKTYLLGVTYKL